MGNEEMKIDDIKKGICNIWIEEKIMATNVTYYYPTILWNLQQFMHSLKKDEN